jgi:hypothetical protein
LRRFAQVRHRIKSRDSGVTSTGAQAPRSRFHLGRLNRQGVELHGAIFELAAQKWLAKRCFPFLAGSSIIDGKGSSAPSRSPVL